MPKPTDRSQQAVRRDSYEAMLDIKRAAQEGQDAYAIAKFTYKIEGGQLRGTEPEPLLNDFLDPDLDPRLTADTDFWPYKYATDFVVIGSAFAPGGVPVPSIQVGVDVGSVSKRIAVFGRREITWAGGRPRIGDPQPFTEIPITWENAYGGTDWRVPFQHEDFEDDQVLGAMVAEHDHPGMYPRNPFGRGYLVESGEVPKMLMPNLEDPQDLLTAERLLVGDPELWWRQPLPWCFDWVSPATFPRYIWVDEDVDAWFPGPEDEELPEVARGYLMPYHSQYME